MDQEGGKRRLLPSTVNPKDRECDFYLNPTILSRLIQNFKYKAAVQRLEKRGPSEAAVWVCTKRKESEKHRDIIAQTSTAASSLTASIISHAKEGYGYRQLPIHMACEALFRVADQSLREDLESLIAHLVIAYPEGCSRRDHEGKLPLHEAIWYDASPETISALLMAYPGASQEKDTRGRYPIQVNEHRNGVHKEAVSSLLRRKNDFWAQAGQEAHYRLKHRNVPSADASVASMSVLACSVKNDDDTLLSTDSFDVSVDPTHPKAAAKHAGHVKALRWTQIEKRAMTLESKLAESYEQNYKLKQEMSQLGIAKKLLQKKVDKLMASDRAMEITELVMEKDELEMKLDVLQSRLTNNGLPINYPGGGDHPETLELPSSMMVVERERNAQLTEQLNAMQAEFAAYQQDKEKEMWELEKKMHQEVSRKDERIRALEAQLQEFMEQMNSHQTAASGATDKTISEFTKSFSSDDETISTEGSSDPSTPSSPRYEDSDEVDTVLQNAIRLNGGHGLSPRLIELWNSVKDHTPTLGRIVEDDIYDRDEEAVDQEDVDLERVQEQESKEERDEYLPARFLLRNSVSTKSTEYFSGRSKMSEDKSTLSGDSDIVLPALDHSHERVRKEVRVPPPPRGGLKQDMSDLTMSVGGASGWTSGNSKERRPETPKNISKEVSELTMSIFGDGYASPIAKDQSHLQEVSELSMSVWN